MKKSIVMYCIMFCFIFNSMQAVDITADDVAKGFTSLGIDYLIVGAIIVIFSLIVVAFKSKSKK